MSKGALYVHLRGKSGCDSKFKAEGRCRLCERPASVRPLTRHRIVPGRLGGRYEPKNVLPLCRPCHDAVEESVEVRRMLRPLLWPIEVAHVLATLGQAWLDEFYPRSAVVAARARQDLLERIAN